MTRDELKKILRDWMKSTVRLSADSDTYRNRRYGSLEDIAKDLAIAFKVQFQIEMSEKWVLRELYRARFKTA